jgi:bla regulator protein blaR1
MMTSPTLHFSESLTEAIAYTLLHSLWQGLLILLVLKSVLGLISEQKSGARYFATAASLLVMFLISFITFFITYRPEQNSTALVGQFLSAHSISIRTEATPTIFEWLSGIVAGYKDSILIGWMAGAFLYTARFAGGYWYLYRLRLSSTVLDNEWSLRVREIAQRLQIKTAITLSESARVYSPIVIGYLKPFIIIPAGLISGLTTDQLEAIFIHELVHIKRNDYLLNLLQSLMEALFFFNPFVWMLSNRLRTEREHCCDDAVLSSGANAKAYVYALASLENCRINNTSLALSLTGNKNELLERIKRLMEKSVKNYSLKEKIVPVLFLFIGLMCASWFSIQRGAEQKKDLSDDKLVAADTSIRKKQKSATYRRKETTVTTPAGKPEKQVVEEFDGDTDLIPPMPGFGFGADFEMPPMPDIDMSMDINMNPFPPMPDLFIWNDSIPPGRRSAEWMAFEQEFTQKFQERFGDFYQKHQDEFQKMMEEFQNKFNEEQPWNKALQEAMLAREHDMAEHALAMQEHAHAFKEQEKSMRKFEEDMKKWEEQNSERLKEMEKNLKIQEEKMRSFEKEMKEELVRDGYVKTSEEIEYMQWDDDGDIKINGKKIKESDLGKYKKLHEKHFGKNADRSNHSD